MSINLALESYPHIFSVRALRQGELIAHYNRKGYKGKARAIKSVTKSIISILYGIAIQRGELSDLDTPVITLFPEFESLNKDPRFKSITLKNLLTMSSGLDCTDQRPRGFFSSNNWLKHYVSRPIKHQPGTKFQYSSASSHLLAACLYKITGLNNLDYARNYLFSPLGIASPKWDHDKQGFYHGGFGLQMSPDDLIHIGMLYLNNGQFEGKQIVDADFLKTSTSFQINGGFPEQNNYGYHWWVDSLYGTDYFFAAGLGGQYLFVVPELELVMVITSEVRRPHIENKKMFELVVNQLG